MNLIFFDIDGTLLPEGDCEISQEVVDAINAIDREKNEIFICTGRCYDQAKRYIEQLKLDSYIVSNGQEVCYKGKLVHFVTFSDEQKEYLLSHSQKYDMLFGYTNRNNINLMDGKYAEYVKSIIEKYGFVDVDITNDISKDVFQFWFFGETTDMKKMKDNLSSKYHRYEWNDKCLEVLPGLQNKGVGIASLIQHIDENVNQTICFGDGINDVEMFEYCDVSCAMENAHETVKERATYIVSKTKEGGIAEGLRKCGLIK